MSQPIMLLGFFIDFLNGLSFVLSRLSDILGMFSSR